MIVEAQGLAQQYANGRGLQPVDFTLQQGTITALAGGNGAGKSTLIRLLTAQDQQSAGQLVWHASSEVRYMPDDVDFPTTLTAVEIMELLGSLKKVSLAEQHALLQRVGLYEVRKQKVQQFSKGMRQRLNLAQSLMGKGQLLILDEPTNGLDPYWIAKLKEMMVAERERGCTVLFSTHLLSFAEELADDVLILHEGKLVANGALHTLLQQHHTANLEQLWLQQITP